MKNFFNKSLCKLVSVTLLIGLSAFIMTACAKGNVSTTDKGTDDSGSVDVTTDGDVTSKENELVFVISSRDGGDLSPFGGDSGGRHHTYRMMYNCLAASLGLGQDLDSLEGQMAKTITVVDPTTIDVELYDYIHDSLGNEIKASDVVYSYNEALASGTMEKLASYLEKIEVTGEYAVRITLSSTSRGAAEWCLTTVPVISEAWFSTATDAQKTSEPATTGAYRLTSLVDGSHTILEKDTNYWQADESLRTYYDKQDFEKITINVISEASMRTVALENAEADIIQNISAHDIGTFMNDDGTPKDGYNAYANENGRFQVMMFNNDNSIFADNKELRQAVLYGIDFESVRHGYGHTATNGSICHDLSPDVASDYNEAWNEEDYYGYDLDKAKSLMAEAGYPDGGFTVRLMYQNSTAATAGLTVVQDYLSQLGIKVELTPSDQALFNAYKYDNTKWDMIVDSKATTDYVTTVWQNVFDTHAFKNGSACFTHDDKLQELLEKASFVDTSSLEARDEFHYYLKDQAYAVGMFWNYTYYVAQDGITDIPQDGFGNVTPSTVKIASDYKSVAK